MNEWASSLPLQSWRTEQAESLLLGLHPRDRQVWSVVEQCGKSVVEAYWKGIPLQVLRDENDAPYVIDKLLDHGRSYTAAHVLTSTLFRKYSPPSELVMSVLSAGFMNGAEERELTEKPNNSLHHDVQELIAYLQQPDVECDRQQLASIEWAYLSMLDGHGGSPVTLHEEIRTKPKFFAQVLTLVFKSEDDESTEEISEEQTARATNAYQLLHSWYTLPGFDPGTGAVEGAELENWVAEARTHCRESGRLGVCDLQIGEMLSHAPGEPDGTWPCLPVRDVIDGIDTQDLREGFAVGIFNQRGVVSKSPF